jgi:hypothetical protein
MNTFNAQGPSPVAPVISDTASCFTCQVIPTKQSHFHAACFVLSLCLGFIPINRSALALRLRMAPVSSPFADIFPLPRFIIASSCFSSILAVSILFPYFAPFFCLFLMHSGVQLRPHLWRFCMKVVLHLFFFIFVLNPVANHILFLDQAA